VVFKKLFYNERSVSTAMLDITFIREHPDQVKADLKRRGDTKKVPWVDDLIKKDKQRRKLKADIDALRAQRNTLSQAINKAKKERQG